VRGRAEEGLSALRGGLRGGSGNTGASRVYLFGGDGCSPGKNDPIINGRKGRGRKRRETVARDVGNRGEGRGKEGRLTSQPHNWSARRY